LTTDAIWIRLVANQIMDCAKCGEPMRLTEKDTSSGRDIREYACSGCGHTDWEDRGPALWQILHDDREEAKAAQTIPAPIHAPGPQVEILEPKQTPASSRWGRFLRWFSGTRKGR
jgi:hypothetical protein